jgi:hypothetical protein
MWCWGGWVVLSIRGYEVGYLEKESY